MAQSLTIPLSIGTSRVGLTLRARLFDPDYQAITGYISDGFSEIGYGFYRWTYDWFPDFWQGTVIFEDADTAEIVFVVTLNPADFFSQSAIRSDDLSLTIFERRKPVSVGGNPFNWVELFGGRYLEPTAFEPDAATYRGNYYYNAITNRLYQKVITVHRPEQGVTRAHWKAIS